MVQNASGRRPGIDTPSALPYSRRRLLRQAITAGAGAPLTASLLTAVGGGGGAATAAASGLQDAAGEARQGGSITVDLGFEPDNLDPAMTPFAVSHSVMMNVFDPLIWLGPDGEYYPGLATAWEAASDGLSYTFHLRDDVIFHDGTPFNGVAVQKFLDRVVDPATQSGFAASLIGPYAGTEVVDDFTIVVRLEAPFAPFIDGLSQAFLGIPSPTAVEADPAAFGANPVGTGFMRFKEWVRQDHITLERNPDYAWGSPLFENRGVAHLDEITFRFILENASSVAALQAGDVQMIAIPAENLAELQGDDEYEVVLATAPGLPVVNFLNTAAWPTNELAVRQAIIQAVDRQTWVDLILFGAAEVAHGPLWSSTPGYWDGVESYYPYDPAAAGRTLEAAGWTKGEDDIYEKGGQKLALKWQLTDDSVPGAELIQAQLREAGIDITLNVGDFGLISPAIESGDTNLALIGWISSDPVVLTNVFRSTAPFNNSRVSDSRLDELLDAGETTLDPAERNRIYGEIQKLIMDQALILPMYGNPANWAYRRAYRDIKLDPRTYVWFLDAFVEE